MSRSDVRTRVVRSFRWHVSAVALLFATALPCHSAYAQNGALFLLVPFGARAVGLGEAVVADSTLGTEAMWWNASALARLAKKEVAIHHSQSVVSTNDMLTYAVPSRILGTVAASAMIVNYGDQDATDDFGNPIGNITNRNYQLALSYATPVRSRLSAGLTYKFVMLRFQCTGQCGAQPVVSGNSSAIDLGVQYAVPTKSPVTLGFAVRNVGPALQVRDAEQADPLPLLIQAGVRARVPSRTLEDARSTLDVSADVIKASALGGTAGGLGIALGFRNQVFLRAGYKHQNGEDKGASLGVGFERGAFGFDLARRFTNIAGAAGDPPTFVSLRARF